MANRVLIGKRGTSDYGLYVSNPGVNVLTATDDDLMFNSDAVEGFNVLQSGTVSNARPTVQQGYSESISSWVSYSSLGLTYPPLILLSKDGQSQSAGVSGFDADYVLSGEGIYEPYFVDIFRFSPTFYENDFTNKRFRVYKRRYESAAEGVGASVYGVDTATTTSYFIFAIGDTTANGGANYYTSGP